MAMRDLKLQTTWTSMTDAVQYSVSQGDSTLPHIKMIKLHVMVQESDEKISPTKLSWSKHIPACRSMFFGTLFITVLVQQYQKPI